jgi:aldehyde:ferredoxin oxidoreductase
LAKEVPGGYNGRILRVNLSTKKVIQEDIDELFCRQYIGGAGFISYYMWKELAPGTDALGSDNKLIFALGPISGQQVPGAARHCVGAKSPQTGGIAKSEAGGYWAVELKRAGYDAIIIDGKSEHPCYLYVDEKNVELRDARHLWGKETKETQEAIRSETGDNKVEVCLIGPGGENLVKYACLMFGLKDAAGRGGLGAVMGSKNLKAVAVRGQRQIRAVDREKIKEIRQRITSMGHYLTEYGTGDPSIEAMIDIGYIPVRNFRDGAFPEIKYIHGGAIKDAIRIGMDGCYACPVRCKKIVQFDEPYHVDAAYGGPEYETMAGLGTNCGISNLKAVAKGNERCGAYSIDTISAGGTIAFAMECFEKGLLTTRDTDGIELRFGNDEAMLQAIELIAKRKGFGNLLADGSEVMAKTIGKGSEDFAMQVKGLEAGYHEPRVSLTMGLGFMVCPTGADHGLNVLSNGLTPEELHAIGLSTFPSDVDLNPQTISKLILGQSKAILGDALGICGFLPYTMQDIVELTAAVTGWDISLAELLVAAERVLTLSRLINIREGLSTEDDKLPERFYQPKADGPPEKPLDRDMMEKAKSTYYILMGWDKEGNPLPEKIEALGIEQEFTD